MFLPQHIQKVDQSLVLNNRRKEPASLTSKVFRLPELVISLCKMPILIASKMSTQRKHFFTKGASRNI